MTSKKILSVSLKFPKKLLILPNLIRKKLYSVVIFHSPWIFSGRGSCLFCPPGSPLLLHITHSCYLGHIKYKFSSCLIRKLFRDEKGSQYQEKQLWVQILEISSYAGTVEMKFRHVMCKILVHVTKIIYVLVVLKLPFQNKSGFSISKNIFLFSQWVPSVKISVVHGRVRKKHFCSYGLYSKS